MRTSLRTKLVRTMIAMLLIIGSTTLLVVAGINYVSSRATLATIESHLRDNIRRKGTDLVAGQALALRDLVNDNAFGDVARLVERTTEQDEQIAYGLFLGDDLRPWGYARGAPPVSGPANWKDLGIDPAGLRDKGVKSATKNLLGRTVFEFATAVVDDKGDYLGSLRYGISDQSLQRALADARATSKRALVTTVVLLLLLGAAGSVLGVLISRRAASRITRPVSDLTTAVTALGEGRRDIRVSIDSGDELQLLGAAFNKMVSELQDSYRRLEQRQAELEALNNSIERKVVERTNQLAASREQYRLLVETTKTIPCEIDPISRRFRYIGPQVQEMLGVAPAECLSPDFLADHLHPDERDKAMSDLGGAVSTRECELEFRLRRADGNYLWARLIASVSSDDLGGQLLRGMILDVTQTRELEMQLRQAQKLESVGRLASGVAHEINTPVQFVSDSVHFVRDAFGDLATLISKYQGLRTLVVDDCPGTQAAEAAAELIEAEQDADLSYLLESVPQALGRSVDGLGRIAEIVRSMKEFAHPDQKEMTTINLNQAILSTLTIARNEYKYVADVETHLDDLPPVTCYAGEVNQVVLNIIVNAAHAIGDVVKGSDRKGRITVRSHVEGNAVVIGISDSGTGIPEHIRDRVFDPFFTTKEVGKGTGQGLAIARSVIVDKHGGELTVESEIGKGSTFLIRLPIAGKPSVAREIAA